MSTEREATTASPLLRYLRRSLEDLLPPEARTELASFDPAIQATTAKGDLHRAVRCAEWAVDLAGDHRRGGHLSSELGEVVRLMRDIEFGMSFGVMVGDLHRAKELLEGHFRGRDTSVGAIEDIELQLVDNALAAAQRVASTRGWDAVPWEDLLGELVTAHT